MAGSNSASGFLRKDNVIRFDHEEKTYAIYRTADGDLYATDGICTHGNAHLADGYVSGTLIECASTTGVSTSLTVRPGVFRSVSQSRPIMPANTTEKSSSTSIRPAVAASSSLPPPTDSASSATTM